MFYGTDVSTATTVEEAVKLAGLNFDIDKEQLGVLRNGTFVPTGGFAVSRRDNGYFLSGHKAVAKDWTPLPNAKKFQFFQPFVDSKVCKLDTAGSLSKGSIVYVSALISNAEREIVKNDTVMPYFLLSDGFDGGMSVHMGFVPFRTSCRNTLMANLSHKFSKIIRLRHSKNVVYNFDNVAATVNMALNEFNANVEQYKLLATKHINQNDVVKYVKKVFNFSEEEKISKKSENILSEIYHIFEKPTTDQVMENFEAGQGTENVASRGTLWTAYNAVTEYLSWQRGRGEDTRLRSLLFGNSARDNRRAFEIALEMAN